MFETIELIKERAKIGDIGARAFLEYVESISKDWIESIPTLQEQLKGGDKPWDSSTQVKAQAQAEAKTKAGDSQPEAKQVQ